MTQEDHFISELKRIESEAAATRAKQPKRRTGLKKFLKTVKELWK